VKDPRQVVEWKWKSPMWPLDATEVEDVAESFTIWYCGHCAKTFSGSLGRQIAEKHSAIFHPGKTPRITAYPTAVVSFSGAGRDE